MIFTDRIRQVCQSTPFPMWVLVNSSFNCVLNTDNEGELSARWRLLHPRCTPPYLMEYAEFTSIL